jgi:hypothetical protein
MNGRVSLHFQRMANQPQSRAAEVRAGHQAALDNRRTALSASGLVARVLGRFRRLNL